MIWCRGGWEWKDISVAVIFRGFDLGVNAEQGGTGLLRCSKQETYIMEIRKELQVSGAYRHFPFPMLPLANLQAQPSKQDRGGTWLTIY